MIKQYLLSPGPTPIPSEVQLAMAQTMIHHRTPEFAVALDEARQGLKTLYSTNNDVIILASSGTGAMEAAVANLFSPADKVIVVNGGKFGERWLRICQAFGLNVAEVKVEWGKAVQVSAVEKALETHPDTKGVLIQASETSTTTLHPVREIAALTRDGGPLLVVDGVTAVGVLSIPMDDWGIDALVTGSQKALMLPPGLAFIGLSNRAWQRTRETTSPRFYFNLESERKGQAKGSTAYTPAVSLVFGLCAALKLMREETFDKVYARHDRMARATRAAVGAMGLELLAPDNPSPAATGLYVPEGADGDTLLEYLRLRMGVILAEGQDHLQGKVIRIAHVGYMGDFDVIVAVSALEMAFSHFGLPVTLGRAVAAAEEILLEARD